MVVEKKHSTITALTAITHQLNYNWDNDFISATLTTDQTAGFDTVDTSILLDKMEHYGIRDKELSLFKSYLSERYQFTQIDTFNSTILKSLDCSCIQGGKLSGTIYSIYTSEIPQLYKLLYDDFLEEIIGEPKWDQKENINHMVINFVDDSTSIIGFKGTELVKKYITKYYKLLHNFHLINKLQINSDKTQLMLSARNKYKDFMKNFSFYANNDIIYNTNKMKILGVILEQNLNWDIEIGTLCANLHSRLKNIQNISKYLNFHTRKQFISAIVVGKLQYAIPLYTNINNINILKIHRIIMSSARTIIGNYCFKKSIKYILDKVNLLDAKQFIIFSAINIIHKLISNSIPSQHMQNKIKTFL